jgi:biopolymer transport protein ExbD
MKLRQHITEEPDLNLTPLIDVVFLLLIFFMVSTTFNKDTELSIELPEASGEIREVDSKEIIIGISRSGTYSINDEQLVKSNIDTLKRAIKQAVGDRENPPLVISGDSKVDYQLVISAMDAVRQLGYTHLTFATKQVPDEN